MLRNRAVALILGLVASPLVIALGLGSLHSESALNEPFDGRIEILGATADDFDALKVGLAARDQFDRAGIALHPLLYKLKFGVEENESGDNFISVTSKDPIREPYLNFLVEMNWANGRLLREYTVLLNPSLYDENRGRSQPEVAAVAPATQSPSEPPVAGTPIASSDNARSTSVTGPYSAGREIGPIVATDTLWSIASLNRPDEAVSVQQMMLALLRENPDAFVDGNINLLRRGAILRLPEAASIGGVSAEAAFEEARRQHQVWEQYRDQVTAEPSAQLIGAEATPPARPATPTPVADGDARLELVAPQGEDGGAAPGSGAGEDLLTEALDATTQDNAELTGKLLEAEEIIDLLQSQVNIQDSELAALQARLATLGVELGDDTLSQRAGIGTEVADRQATDDGAQTGADADSTVAEQDDGTAIESDSATPVDSDDTMVEVDEDQDAAAYDEVDEVVVDYVPAPEAAPGFPANLIPPHLAAAVPGGAITILGVITLLILGLFGVIVGFLMRRRGAGKPTPVASASPVAEEQDDDEDATITAGSLDDGAEAVTEIGASDKSFDANATVEAEAADDEAITEVPLAASDAPVDEEPEEDPLEEMNVYLAYERFDQAEELCKRVIGEHPDRHDYKLRLLEVYYSSNDRGAYETSARELFDVVSEGDPLRDSAVAMWSEMSPDRALFEEGGDAQAQPEQEQASAFVDITGDAEPGEDTVAHAPGDDDDVDFDLSGDDSGAVVDLTASEDTVEVVPGSASSKASDDGVLDLTAVDDGSAVDAVTAGVGDDDGMIDLTAGAGEDDPATGPASDDTIDSTVADAGDVLDLTADTDDDEVLDLTATAGENDVLDLSLGDDDGIFDLTAGEDEEPAATGDDDVLDLTDGGGEVDLLEVTSGGNTDAAMGSDLLNVASDNDTDLLDVTKTGDVSSFDDADLLNVTSPGLSGDEEFSADEPELDVNLEITDTAEESVLDFDISETVATAFDEETATEQTNATDGDDILDLTGGGSAEDSDDALMDFDIGALNADSSDIDPEAPTMVDGRLEALDEDAILTVDLDSALSEESASVDSGAELDFDITMGSEELNSALDVVEEDDGDGRLEITMSSADDDPVDGDVALQGEELGEISLGLGDDEEFDFALDGTTEMDSIGADETLDMGSVSTQDGGEISLDTDIGTSLDELAVQLEERGGDDDAFSLDLDGLEVDGEIDSELDHLETVAMEPGDDGETEDADDKTLVMPVSNPVERQSDADEADTKLNLAKAYIELGDSDGARSILDEVATEGNEIQQAEAQSLLSQLT